jgi:23S rRNA (adenine-N6)-dimethyltransferase
MQFELEYIEAVPRSPFFPMPGADGALFRIRRRAKPLVGPGRMRLFAGVAAFTLRHPDAPVASALSGVFTPPQISRLCRLPDIAPDEPVCKLTEDRWAALFRAMIERVPTHRWPRPKR